MRSKDLRNLRGISREISAWAREMDDIRRGQAKPAAVPAITPAAPTPSLPPGYSYVTCKECDSPAILLRAPHSFAALCPACRLITMIDTIDEEPRKCPNPTRRTP